MLGKIHSIINNIVEVKLDIDINNQTNLINLHTIFEDNNTKLVGQIMNIEQNIMKVLLVGEIKNNSFFPGNIKKPSFKSSVRIINFSELELIFGKQDIVDNSKINIGISNIYENYKINVDVNTLFSNHFTILGNTGSGKSFAISRILQNIFSNKEAPINSNIFLFDAYGEYHNALNNITEKNSLIKYKYYATDLNEIDNIIRIPLWLMGVDDVALLLNAVSADQLPIIEKSLKLVGILSNSNETKKEHKNDIIARAITDILLSNYNAGQIRNQVMAILTNFYTEELNLDTQIYSPGYTRPLKQLLYVDEQNKIQDINILVKFLSSFFRDDLELSLPKGDVMYTLNDLEKAFDFALVSEGVLKSDKVFDSANMLKVRLHSLANSDIATYFDYPEYINREDFIKQLVLNKDNEKCQIINFNINYIDDRMAKVVTKVISKMLFDFSTSLTDRGSIPIHIIMEEAHRYVQDDNDSKLLGYNIFERITKEGRKYGILLGLITQRPSELSETVISQCSNFIILRMLHPRDLEYIKKMIPSISDEIMNQLKILQSGDAICFGTAFKVPTSLKFVKPNPEPLSNNVNIMNTWY